MLAAVTVGLYMGWYTPELTNAETRLQGEAFWEILTFILNAALFALVGLQLPHVLDALDGWSAASSLVGDGASCAGGDRDPARLGVPARVPPALACRRGSGRAIRAARGGAARPRLGGHARRGLARRGPRDPADDRAARRSPDRDLIIFLTSCVILTTLVLQGPHAAAPDQLVGLEDDEAEAASEEAKARIRAAEVALERLEELVEEGGCARTRPSASAGCTPSEAAGSAARLDPGAEARSRSGRGVPADQARAPRAEARRVVELRREGVISDDVMNRILRDLALEELRLDFGA